MDEVGGFLRADPPGGHGLGALVIAVVSGDGPPGSGDIVQVSNFPTSYPLPDGQHLTLEQVRDRLPALLVDGSLSVHLANTSLPLPAGAARDDTLEARLPLEAGRLAARVDGTVNTREVDTGYTYAAGTAAGTVAVPAGSMLREVSVIAGLATAATVTIAGGAVITIPAGWAKSFYPRKLGALDVVIGGAIQSYYVEWETR